MMNALSSPFYSTRRRFDAERARLIVGAALGAPFSGTPRVDAALRRGAISAVESVQSVVSQALRKASKKLTGREPKAAVQAEATIVTDDPNAPRFHVTARFAYEIHGMQVLVTRADVVASDAWEHSLEVSLRESAPSRPVPFRYELNELSDGAIVVRPATLH